MILDSTTVKSVLLVALISLTLPAALGAELFVSPTGKDTNPGTQASPLATLGAARNAARPVAAKEPVTVHVADGVYYLAETLVFTPADSGSEAHPVVYQAVNEGGAVLSGGAGLSLSWKPYQNGIFQAQTPAGLSMDQLFINGKSQRMARYPNYDAAKKAQPYQGYAADAFSKDRADGWSDPTGGYIHAMHRKRWGGYHYRITGKNAKGEVTYEGGWQNNRQMGMHKAYRMVENIFEELDTAGEWFHNAGTQTLYFKPVPGTDLATATVEVVRLRHLVELQGSSTKPVKHIAFVGFVVRHAARTFMDCKEQMLRSDWAIYRGGAFMLTGTENVRIQDCEFDQVGGNAIFVNNYNRRTLVKGCHIHDAGASGVCFVGAPNAVRDPLFEYGEKNDLTKIDRTPGPKTDNYPAESAVEDCLIHGIGRVERQPAGVQIEMAQGISVRDCSIYDCARAGINIGDGAWGGHLIERCDVFDTVLETHDHGSFNSWGRDRYWRSDHLTSSQKAVDADPALPFLDAVKTTVIRDSRWRCDHGWDIDLDDGSSNYHIYNNLMLNKGLKLREGFGRKAWNNLAPFGSLHPHVWFQRSKDQVYSNIFAAPHRTARMNKPYTDETMVDRNLFASNDKKILKQAAQLGWDANSALGDPLFIAPASGDFRVKDGSPALKLGFQNFPMDQFGVKKPALKKIAETPEIPATAAKVTSSKPAPKGRSLVVQKRGWLGATLTELEGEAFSAFGVSKEAAGVIVEIPAGCAAAEAGLRNDDVIQGIDGKATSNLKAFLTQLPGKSGSVVLEVIRDQAELKLTVKLPVYIQLETASAPGHFKELPVSTASGRTVLTNLKTGNQPLASLTDGKLTSTYGPIFANGVHTGVYKMDLGSSQAISAISSWSYNQGSRVTQKLTVYASNSVSDPGWNLNKLTLLGSIDTSGVKAANYMAASLRAAAGSSLGKYRWILWSVAPVSNAGGGENTAFQELAVE